MASSDTYPCDQLDSYTDSGRPLASYTDSGGLLASHTNPSGIPSTWDVTTRLTGDTCGAGEGTPFAVTLTPDGSGNIYLQRFNMVYFLYPAGTHSGYIGQLFLGDATYTMDLFFTGPATFVAYEYVTFASYPGCYWMFEWTGTLLY